MSVYLPKLDSYAFNEPELFIKEGLRKARKNPKGFSGQADVSHGEVLQLPDIRINNGVLLSRDSEEAEGDLLTASLDERALQENQQRTTHRVTFEVRPPTGERRPSEEAEEVLLDAESSRNRRPSRSILRRSGWGAVKEIVVSGQDKGQRGVRPGLEGRRKSRRSGSLHLLLQQLQTSSSGRGSISGPDTKTLFPDSEAIKKRFQQAIKAVMTIRRLATLMIKKSEEPSAMLKTFTDLIDLSDNFNENLKNQGLSFDPSYFKANKEISVSNEVKSILSMPPSFRSHEQIQTAIYGLQSLQSFAEYPLHMQEKLAKVAWYEVVPPKRTIIRQGHYAENFYFILSGQVVVTILIRDQKTGESHVRTANFMRKGTSFGELALLHHSRRTATVTSHDTVQLLSIGRDDFFDIFMARHGMDDVPEHIRFVSQLDFLKGWPIDRLLEHPEYCLLHFFKRNMVIVKDSKQSDWIYIVKSGSCQVLKQLQGVTARLGTHRYVAPEDDIFRLPHTGTALRGPKIDTGIRRRRKKSDRVRLLPFYRSEDGDQRRQNGMRLPRLAESEGSGLLVTRRSQLPPIDHLLQQSASSSDPPKLGQFSKKNYVETPKTGKVHFRALAARDPKAPDNDSSPLKGQQSLATNNTSTSSLPLADPPSQQPPVFVQVSILKPRDIFGLEVILFPDELETPQTSVSLVSLGAECIMLSKDFFRKHATDFVKKNLQEIVRLYPDEETFQDSLQRKADWDLYKQTLINDLTSAQVV